MDVIRSLLLVIRFKLFNYNSEMLFELASIKVALILVVFSMITY